MIHPSMLAQLKLEANALAALPEHVSSRFWSINPSAGTVRHAWTGELIAYLHPAVLGPIPGFYFLPRDRGST